MKNLVDETLFSGLPVAAVITDMSGIILDSNKLAQDLLNVSSRNLLNKNLASLFEKNEKKKVTTLLKRLSNDSILNIEARINSKRANWVEITANKIEKDQREINLVFIRDISDKIEDQKRIKLHYEISKAISQGQNLDDTLFKIIKVITDNSRWFCGVAWLANSDNSLSYICSSFPKSLLKTKFITLTINGRINNLSLPYKVFHAKQPRWVPDFRKIGGYRQQAAIELGIRSAYSFPIFFENKIFCILEFFSLKTEFPEKELYNLTSFINSQLESFIRRRLNEIRTAESEERYRDLVEVAPDIIYSVDEKGNVKTLNEAYERITKLSRSEMIGRSFTELIHPDDRSFAEDKIRKNLRRKNPKVFSARILTQSEDSFVISEVRHRKGFGVIIDLTDRYHLEKQKDLWFGIATHELKTPLTSIKAFTQLLMLESNSDINFLQNIDEQVNRMTDLVNDLLDVTRINSGSMELSLENSNVDELVRRTVDLVQPISVHKIECDLKRSPSFKIDAKRITQVIYNLISNAIKYSPDADKIIISSFTENGYYHLAVQDFGIGMPKSETGKIFTPFYRAHTNKASKTPGLGIGLYISKTIVSLHKGKIWVDSKVGSGSTFYFSLPIRQD